MIVLFMARLVGVHRRKTGSPGFPRHGTHSAPPDRAGARPAPHVHRSTFQNSMNKRRDVRRRTSTEARFGTARTSVETCDAGSRGSATLPANAPPRTPNVLPGGRDALPRVRRRTFTELGTMTRPTSVADARATRSSQPGWDSTNAFTTRLEYL